MRRVFTPLRRSSESDAEAKLVHDSRKMAFDAGLVLMNKGQVIGFVR